MSTRGDNQSVENFFLKGLKTKPGKVVYAKYTGQRKYQQGRRQRKGEIVWWSTGVQVSQVGEKRKVEKMMVRLAPDGTKETGREPCSDGERACTSANGLLEAVGSYAV